MGAQALASTPQDPKVFEQVSCRKQLDTLLDHWGATRDWMITIGRADGMRIYRTPTDRTGSWAAVTLFPDRHVEASRVSWSTQLRVRFESPDCQARVESTLVKHDAKLSADAFTDEALEAAIAHTRRGVIYAWSPHMPLSVLGLGYIHEAAKKLHADVITVLDPMAQARAVRDLVSQGKVKREATRRIASLDLLMRGMNVHYPSILVVRDGKIASHMLPGLESEKLYEDFMRKQLAR
jgi:hypothetical protein